MRLGDVFDLQMGKTPARANSQYWNDGANPWVSIADLSSYDKYVGATKESISDVAVSESSIKPVPANTVIMSFKLSLGKAAITRVPVYTNEAIMAFIPKADNTVFPDYFYHFCSGNDWSAGTNRAVMGATLNKATLSQIEIDLPPLDEQRRIAAVLDKAAALIDLRKQQLAKLDELVKARFVEMFGDPESNPFGWNKQPLSTVIQTANNGMARRGNDENGSIVMRLVELQDGYIDYSAPNRILLSEKEKERYLLKEQDFLFARVNGNPENVGRCAVFHDIGEPVYHNDHIIRVHFDDTIIEGTFASALLNSSYGKRQLKSQIKTSAGQYTVSQDGIGAIEAILPPLELQNQFAAFVKQLDKSKAVVQKSLDEAQLLFDSLMQKYFG